MLKKNKNYRYGEKLSYNVSAQVRYYSEIKKLIDDMATKTQKKVLALFRAPVAQKFKNQQAEAAAMDAGVSDDAKKLIGKLQKEFKALFTTKAPIFSVRMIAQADKSSSVALTRSIKKLVDAVTVKMDFIPKGLKQITKSILAENVSLITTIPEEYFKNITGVVMRSITTGMGMDELTRHLHKYYGTATNKARNVASDQSRKAYNAINKQRMMAAGYKEFEWLHSGGGLHPRKDHIAMDGKIYSFDKLPVIDKETGERGIPGQAINCKCTMRPVYRLENEGKI